MERQPDESRLSQLEAKWLDGTITPEEAREYAEWYNAGQDASLEIPAEFADSPEALRQRMLARILSVQEEERSVGSLPDKRRVLLPVWTRVAAAILVVAAGLWLVLRQPAKQAEAPVAANIPGNAPSHSGALLTLSNGRQIVLDSAGNGLLSTDGNARVMKKDGQLTYGIADSGAGMASGRLPVDATSELVYNTLSTARGKQWQLTLPDGTRVWLNAASSIRYPLRFAANERSVEITGEAYFEVVHRADQPFRVRTAGQVVEDIGTHFNINAYSNEETVKTTLEEGSVSVSSGSNKLLLQPGQQSRLIPGAGKLALLPHADVEEALAWKNGMFSFQGADIGTILRQVCRWYDLDVVIEKPVQEKFYLEFSRNETPASLFAILEKTGGVHCRMEGKKVFINP